MIAGFALLEEQTGVKRTVIGIDASATIEQTRDQVGRIARHTAGLIDLDRELRDDDIDIRTGWEGPAYGIPDDSTIAAIRTTAELEGVILDPVYEGKSMAGLIGLAEAGEFAEDSPASTPTSGGSSPSTPTARLRLSAVRTEPGVQAAGKDTPFLPFPPCGCGHR